MRVKNAEYVRSAVKDEDFLRDERPQVVFVGRSNVGKSTLLNRLVGRNALARISSKPGRTRAVNYFDIDKRFYFVDLPGYGYARVSKTERQAWAQLMDQFLRSVSDTAMVVQLVDAYVGATALDEQATEYLRSLGIEPLIAATKADRVPRGKREKALSGIRKTLDGHASRVMAVSGTSGEGLDMLWKTIDRYLEKSIHRGLKQGVIND